MTYSKHYINDRQERQNLINTIGIGKVIHTEIAFDEKRGRTFKYEITSNAVLIVKDRHKDFVITQMVARPSRIKKYWSNAPQEIIQISIEHTRKGYWI